MQLNIFGWCSKVEDITGLRFDLDGYLMYLISNQPTMVKKRLKKYQQRNIFWYFEKCKNIHKFYLGD